MTLLERIIDVYWADNLQGKKFEQDLTITAFNRRNILMDIINAINTLNVTLLAIRAEISEETNTKIKIKIMIEDTERLNVLVQNLYKVKDIYFVPNKATFLMPFSCTFLPVTSAIFITFNPVFASMSAAAKCIVFEQITRKSAPAALSLPPHNIIFRAILSHSPLCCQVSISLKSKEYIRHLAEWELPINLLVSSFIIR